MLIYDRAMGNCGWCDKSGQIFEEKYPEGLEWKQYGPVRLSHILPDYQDKFAEICRQNEKVCLYFNTEDGDKICLECIQNFIDSDKKHL